MKMIRYTLSSIIIAFLTFPLFSCGKPESVSSNVSSPEPTSDPSIGSITATDPEPISELSLDSRPHISFDGTVLDYAYWYEEGRDRDWEEDVLYLAEVFLRREPRLTEIAYTYEFDSQIIRSTNVFYDQELRESFIDAIELLISQIY